MLHHPGPRTLPCALLRASIGPVAFETALLIDPCSSHHLHFTTLPTLPLVLFPRLCSLSSCLCKHVASRFSFVVRLLCCLCNSAFQWPPLRHIFRLAISNNCGLSLPLSVFCPCPLYFWLGGCLPACLIHLVLAYFLICGWSLSLSSEIVGQGPLHTLFIFATQDRHASLMYVCVFV